MKRARGNCLGLLALLAAGTGQAEELQLDRLPPALFDIQPPSARVDGAPGAMRVVDRSCSRQPDAGLRKRLVDVAIQEWAFFGFSVLDQTTLPEADTGQRSGSWRRPQLSPEESARVAASIAGYWAVTPDGNWILERQNQVWQGSSGVASRWRDPWSAAFISWVMCEAGLSEPGRFRRAIAHHTYIDQAIAARDTGDPLAAFEAFEVGERPIEPGDMLCLARRPGYRTVAERRAQLGTGIRSHCDIVVKVDVPRDRILVIGGNVRGSVRLKLHAAEFTDDSGSVRSVGRGRRTVFAHLKLDAGSIGSDALDASPTMRSLAGRDDAIATLRERLQDDSLFEFADGSGPVPAAGNRGLHAPAVRNAGQ